MHVCHRFTRRCSHDSSHRRAGVHRLLLVWDMPDTRANARAHRLGTHPRRGCWVGGAAAFQRRCPCPPRAASVLPPSPRRPGE